MTNKELKDMLKGIDLPTNGCVEDLNSTAPLPINKCKPTNLKDTFNMVIVDHTNKKHPQFY